MPSDETATPNPWWLTIVLLVEALAWLGLIIVGAFFALLIAGFGSPDAPAILAIYAFLFATCIGVIVIFVVNAFKKSSRSTVEKIGVVHNLAGSIASFPVIVLSAYGAIKSGVDGDVGGALSTAVVTLFAMIVPIIGWLLTRSKRDVAKLAGAGLGIVWCCVADVMLFMAFTSLAVAGGMQA